MCPQWILCALNGLWYDPNLTQKINDCFKFPFKIDLAEFLDEMADRTKPWKYKLHGVIMHSGDLDSGHYFAFIKPDKHSRWLKFDDEWVTSATDWEVMKESYGRELLNNAVPQIQRNQVGVINKSTNACQCAIFMVFSNSLFPSFNPPYV